MKKTMIAAMMAFGMVATSAAAETWDMATPYPDKTFHTVNIAEFAENVESLTDGELAIKIHSSGSLFKHPDIKGAVRGGQVPIGEFFLSLLSNENPVFGADSLPFLASTYDEAAKLWEAQKPVVEELLKEQGLMPLFTVPWPPQGLFVKDEVNSVADLQGLKFRAYNATLESFASLVGAAPTPVEVPDIPQAFSTGRVEAMITSPSTGVNSQSWDYVTNYYDIQAWIPKNVVVVNIRSFRRLEDNVRDAVLEAAATAETRGWEMSKAETETNIKLLAENGMTVHEPSPELMSGLREIGAKMLTDWQNAAGAEGEALLGAYNN